MKKRQELLIVSYIATVGILISSLIIFFIEHTAQPQVFQSIGSGAWWTVVTITSLGYGDMIPITTVGRVFGSVLALCGIVLFSIPGAILGSGFIEVMLEHQKAQQTKERNEFLSSISQSASKSRHEQPMSLHPQLLSRATQKPRDKRQETPSVSQTLDAILMNQVSMSKEPPLF